MTAERARRDERKEIVHVGQMCVSVCVSAHVEESCNCDFDMLYMIKVERWCC